MKSDKKGSCGKQPRVGKKGDLKPVRGLGMGLGKGRNSIKRSR